MVRVVRTAVLLAGFGVAFGACFIEPAKPATFRFECDSEADCEPDHVCANGLCQVPCGLGQEACSGSVCINGFCSNLCPLDEEVCPSPQRCVSLTPPSDDPSDDDEPESGVCTILCDAVEFPCADGQACLLGLCVNECETVDDCGSGEDCLPIGPDTLVCVPTGGGGGSFP